ncbi:MAG: hypothetical protein AAFY38_16850 [Pseudomonadota bacterium]
MSAPENATDEERKTPLFDIYVMLEEPLQFSTGEIEAALLEDYPMLDINGVDPDGPLNIACDTDQFVTSPMLMTAKGDDAHFVTLVRVPGYGTWDPAQIPARQSIQVPDLADRLARNRSYICVSAGAKDDTPLERFRAARRATCVAALFCKLPGAVAVYWQTGDHFLTPEAVVSAADKAISDSYPMMEWCGLQLGQDAERGVSQALSVGLNALGGFEISFAAAPVPLGDAANHVLTTATMLLELGHDFSDGDTLGVEGQAPEESIRLRFVPEGTNGSTCDTWLLVHPQSPVDADELVGPSGSVPAPPGQSEERRSDMGFFKRMIRGKRDS